ncbi:MAG: hypothetical protein HY721_23680 [Planctomycetes bacterium]|nr:hypothetical protein [Planctomycetota bacterium]
MILRTAPLLQGASDRAADEELRLPRGRRLSAPDAPAALLENGLRLPRSKERRPPGVVVDASGAIRGIVRSENPPADGRRVDSKLRPGSPRGTTARGALRWDGAEGEILGAARGTTGRKPRSDPEGARGAPSPRGDRGGRVPNRGPEALGAIDGPLRTDGARTAGWLNDRDGEEGLEKPEDRPPPEDLDPPPEGAEKDRPPPPDGRDTPPPEDLPPPMDRPPEDAPPEEIRPRDWASSRSA